MCHGGRVFRLLGLLGGLSAVLDLGTGSASDESLTRCLVATRFARHLGLPPEDVATVLYTSLLEHLGCTAYASQAAAIFGDDVATTRRGVPDRLGAAGRPGADVRARSRRRDGTVPPSGAGHSAHGRTGHQRRGASRLPVRSRERRRGDWAYRPAWLRACTAC